MAGVAPQQRGGGLNGTMIGLIASIVVNVALLVVLIIMLTGQEELRNSATNAQTAKSRIASPGDEQTAKQMFPDAGSGTGKTLVGEMNSAVKALVGRISGNVTDKPDDAIKQLNAELEQIIAEGKFEAPDKLASTNAVKSIIKELYAAFASEKASKEQALAGLTKANKELEDAVGTNKKLEDKFSADLASLNTRVADMQKNKSDFEEKKNSEIQALAAQIDAKAEQLSNAARDQQKMRMEFASALNDQHNLLKLQRDKLGVIGGEGPPAAQPLALARKPIGKVVRALPGDSLVHIDKGKNQRVSLGMTFTIYSSDRPIPADGHGKAMVEVVSLGPNTSECRVRTAPSPDDPILPGDYAGNIVLSRNQGRPENFVIVGQFDLDYDGVPDPRSGEAIAALVERYGGRVMQQVDATTDYVIVGREPPGTNGGGIDGIVPRPSETVPPPTNGAAGDGGSGDESGGDADATDSDAGEDDADKKDEDKPADDESDKDDESGDDEESDPPGYFGMYLPMMQSDPPQMDRGIDHTKGPTQLRAMSEAERYSQSIRRAMSLAIPRLTQDHFLNFVGIEPGVGALKKIQP